MAIYNVLGVRHTTCVLLIWCVLARASVIARLLHQSLVIWQFHSSSYPGIQKQPPRGVLRLAASGYGITALAASGYGITALASAPFAAQAVPTIQLVHFKLAKSIAS